jgi:hypothetical protein
MSALETPE